MYSYKNVYVKICNSYLKCIIRIFKDFILTNDNFLVSYLLFQASTSRKII